MGFFLGIDAGGSKTACAVGDEHNILGSATTGAGKMARVGERQARAALQEAILSACAEAKIDPREVQSACVGMAGVTLPDVIQSVSQAVAEITGSRVEVVGDMVVALEAAFNGGPGAITVAGTGSICFGRNDRGETARAGGWGPAVSDEGSGDWIGRAAVAAAMRAHDSGQHTALLPAIMDAWRLATREDLCRMANSSPPADFAALFPSVLQAAEKDDPIATEILSRAGFELAQLARMVVRRLWPGPQRVRVSISGGVFQNSRQVRQVFVNTLRAERPEAAVSFATVEPVAGALSLARKAALVHR